MLEVRIYIEPRPVIYGRRSLKILTPGRENLPAVKINTHVHYSIKIDKGKHNERKI